MTQRTVHASACPVAFRPISLTVDSGYHMMQSAFMKCPPVTTKRVLITGCSTGIGAVAALQLKARNWDVIPTARKQADLDRLKEEGFEPVFMDMADADSVATGAAEVLERTGGTLGAVVNNAGFAQSGALEDVQREHLREQFEVNVLGLQDLTNRLIPTFRKQGFGRIVQISSVVGRVSIPYLGAYSASKFAVEALADAQRIELRGSGIGVILVEPGPIITNFRKNTSQRALDTLDLEGARLKDFYKQELEARVARQKKPDWINKSPEDVSRAIIHALESPRPKRRYVITSTAHFGALMRRFAPDALTDFILSRKGP